MAEALKLLTQLSRPRAAVEKDYVRCIHKLAPDPKYHFSMALSRQWKAANAAPAVPTEESPFGMVARFCRVTAPAAEIAILVSRIPREVDPAEWTELYLDRINARIADRRRLPSRFGEVGDYLSTLTADGQVYVARSIGIKDDSLVFVAHCQVPQDGYPAVAEEFLMAVRTFEIANPTGIAYAEPMATTEVVEPVRFTFLFPASWQRRDDPSPPRQGASFSLVNSLQDQAMGQFTCAAIPRAYEKDYQGLLFNYLGQLRRNGLAIDDQPLEKRQPGKGLQGMWGGLLAAKKGDHALEVRCCVVEHEQAWILFAVVGPDRQANPEAQIINSRAFRLALETFQLR